MSKTRPRQHSSLVRLARKYFVSAFVVFTFTAYAVHERGRDFEGSDPILPPATATDTRQANALVQPSVTAPEATLVVPPTNTQVHQLPDRSTATNKPLPSQTPPPLPTALPTATAVPPTDVPTVAPVVADAGQYKDGQYTGNTANAFYGLVQVKAIINSGKLTDVQILQYPHDRRTSQRINQQAIPYLRSEAIQAQDAEVDIISGATLTSQAFIESLQSALSNARS